MEHCCAYRSRITRCQAKYITWSSAAIKVELRDAHFSIAPVVDFSATGWCSEALRRCICPPARRTTAAVILSATALKSVDSLGQETTMVMYVYSCYPARSMHPSYLDRRGRLKRAGGATERRLRRRGGRSGGGRGPPLCHVLPAMARGRRRAAAADDAPIRERWWWLRRSRRPRHQRGRSFRQKPRSCSRPSLPGHTPGGGNAVHDASTCGVSASRGVRSEERQIHESGYSETGVGNQYEIEEQDQISRQNSSKRIVPAPRRRQW